MEKKTFWIMLATTIVMGLALVFFIGGYASKSSALKKTTQEKDLIEQEMLKFKTLYSDLNAGARSATASVDVAETQLEQCRNQVADLQSQVDSMMLLINQEQAQ